MTNDVEEDDDHGLREELAELFGANARAGAILAAVKVEMALATAIEREFRPISEGFRKQLFRTSNAPLSGMYGKILIGHALNIYSETVMRDLNIIREIRNKFAHEPNINSFNKRSISALCEKLVFPQHHVNNIKILTKSTIYATKFNATVSMLYLGLSLHRFNGAAPNALNGFVDLHYGLPAGAPAPSQKKARVRPTKRNPAQDQNP